MIRSSQWEEALDVTDQLGPQSENDDDELLLMRGCALNGLGRHREAETALRRISAESGMQAYAAPELAHAVAQQGRYDEAEQWLLDSLGRIDNNPTFRLTINKHIERLRELFARRGEAEKDHSAIQTLRRLLPDNDVIELLEA